MTKNSFIAEVTFKVSSQCHVTIRLTQTNELKMFSTEKNLMQTIKITWSKPLALSYSM